MANPRKFSEKIALHTQKQAEETAAFEQILREVQGVTAITAPQQVQQRDQSPAARQPQPHLLNAINNISFRGGSLPNVNQMAQHGNRTPTRQFGNLSTSPRASQNKLGPIRGGQKSRHDQAPYASPPSLTQLNTMAMGGGGTSPTLCQAGSYGTNYLLPPDNSWRRANSDSAINSINSLMIPSVVPDSSEESSNNSNDPRDNYGLSTSPGSGHQVGRPDGTPGVIPTTVGDGPNLLEIPQSVSTGSLPDLTSFQFQTPIQQPVETEEPHNNTSPYSTSPLSMTYSHSPTSCSPHSQQQPTVTGSMPQQVGHSQPSQQQQQQVQHHQQPPRSPLPPHHHQQQHQRHPSPQPPHQQQHSPQQQQQQMQNHQQQHSPQQQQQQMQNHQQQQIQNHQQQIQNHQQHIQNQQQQQNHHQQQQQMQSHQQQQVQNHQQQQQHSPQQASSQQHPSSPQPQLMENPLSVNTSFQQTFTPNENMLTAYRCPPRPSPQNSPSPFRSPSPHDGQLSAPPSPSTQPVQSADSFFLSQQANALQQHFEQISMVDGTPQRNNNGHWQQGGGMVNNAYFYNSGGGGQQQQQQIGATAGVTTQQSPSHHQQPQTPQTPSSIPDIIFTDCTDIDDFLTSEVAAFREGLGPIDTGDFQMLADPNLVLPDPQAEDTFRLDRL